MSLANLITAIENETWKIKEDTDLTTVIKIKEELAACEGNETRTALFADVKQLADVLIDKYLALDQEDRQKMADVYENEESFRKIGGLPTFSRDRFVRILGNKNFLLLRQIFNYRELMRVLENYLQHIENTPNIKVRNSTLTCYLFTHNINGAEVKWKDKDSLANIYRHNFVSNREMKKKSIEAVFKSLTHGVPEDLKQRVRDAMSLLPIRIRILENYVNYVENTPDIKVRNSTMAYYLCNHNLKGEKVKHISEHSLNSFRYYDFVNNMELNKKNIEAVFKSLTHGVPEDLKQRVRDAMSLLPVRRKILENYVDYIENTPDIKAVNSTLGYYLCNHNLKGEKVKKENKSSLVSFYEYDFINNRHINKRSIEAAFKSLTHGVPEDLKQRVRDAMSLLPVRTKILENYVNYVENTPGIKVLNSTLAHYLCNHNLKGEKVKRQGIGSLASFYAYDFVNNRKMDRITIEALFRSLTHGVPEDLKQRVRDAMSLLPVRIRILENYVNYVENTSHIKVKQSTLTYYLYSHNLKGKKVKEGSRGSLYSFGEYDFIENRQSRKKGTEIIFKSLTHGVPEDLKQRVRDAMSLLPVRRKILENYVDYIENTPDIKTGNSTLAYYLYNHNLQGEKVKKGVKGSL